MRNGLENDLNFTGTPDSLTARWMGFNDSLSGILHLEYAVGTSPGESDVVEWNVTIDSIIVERNLSLENGNAYYVSIRAIDRAMNVSAISSSNGVVVDIIESNVFGGDAIVSVLWAGQSRALKTMLSSLQKVNP